jgi:hypothetical protein
MCSHSRALQFFDHTASEDQERPRPSLFVVMRFLLMLHPARRSRETNYVWCSTNAFCRSLLLLFCSLYLCLYRGIHPRKEGAGHHASYATLPRGGQAPDSGYASHDAAPRLRGPQWARVPPQAACHVVRAWAGRLGGCQGRLRCTRTAVPLRWLLDRGLESVCQTRGTR